MELIFWAAVALFALLTPWVVARRRLRVVLVGLPAATLILLAWLGSGMGIRGFANWLAGPERSLPLSAMALTLALIYYRRWTRPWPAGCLLVAASTVMVAGLFDPHFQGIVSRPDNVPIVLLAGAVAWFFWVGLRRAAVNDDRRERGLPVWESGSDDRVMTWPNLVYLEWLAMILCTVVLLIWSILLRAPLEPPANPGAVPNPAKAPWYFLGLQELLVYFDPWLAGVMVPLLIILGLCAIPYLDRNPKGNGYYTFRDRPLAVVIFLAGFGLLWVPLIVIGTFLRGPNWSLFGPFEPWDPHRSAALVNVNLSDLFWNKLAGSGLPTDSVVTWPRVLWREIPGLLLLMAIFVVVPWVLRRTLLRRLARRQGAARYRVTMFLLAGMILIPLKMVLHWTLGLKYILDLGEWGINL